MQPRLNCQFAARKAQRKNEGRCAGAEKGTSGKGDATLIRTCAGRHVELVLSRLFSTAIPRTGLRVNEYATLRKSGGFFLPVFFA